jgi:ferredoxin
MRWPPAPRHPALMAIKRVWIIEGCISCNLCEDVAPEVFEVPAGGLSVLRKGHERHLTGDADTDARIREAADSCPVEVIKIETS